MVKYLKKHIATFQKYFNDNLDFYLYYKSRSSHLDEHYFLPRNKTFGLNMQEYHFLYDEQFSTSHDVMLATIMAYTRLITYLNSEIVKLKRKNHMETTINPFKKPFKFKCTGSKAALVELGVSLTHSGDINHGSTKKKMRSCNTLGICSI